MTSTSPAAAEETPRCLNVSSNFRAVDNRVIKSNNYEHKGQQRSCYLFKENDYALLGCFCFFIPAGKLPLYLQGATVVFARENFSWVINNLPRESIFRKKRKKNPHLSPSVNQTLGKIHLKLFAPSDSSRVYVIIDWSLQSRWISLPVSLLEMSPWRVSDYQ